MGSESIEDFLTKQILIEGNIITYRSLSRQLSLHVNAAKNALATFYMKARRDGESKVAATYLISGEVQLDASGSGAMDMDVDMENNRENAEYEVDDAEEVQLVEVVLVGEKDLQYTTSKFSTIYSTHIYSLSPAPIRDMGLICGPNEIVRDIDNKKGTEMEAIVGKIVGNVQQGKGKPYVPPPPPPAVATSVSGSKSSVPVPSENRTTKKNTLTSEKSKASDFFAKAKPRETKNIKEAIKKETKKNGTEEYSVELNAKSAGASKDSKHEEKPSKRKQESPSESLHEKIDLATSSKAKGKVLANKTGGAKRKLPDSESEDEGEKFPVTVKKNVIVSDEEVDQPILRANRAKGKDKGKQVFKEENDDVLAMMEVDDDQVIRASRCRKASPEPSELEDVEMQDDLDDKPTTKTRKKPKAKKIVPIGKNGVKKKRVMKSKMTLDAKGYMVTEDYSSYESVDEEEPDIEPAKDKGNQGKGASEKTGNSGKTSKTKTTTSESKGSRAKKEEDKKRETDTLTKSKSARGSGASGPGQKKIASFFAKPKGNK